jgi:hypothetical protein
VFARIASFEGGNSAELERMSREAMASGQLTLPAGATGGMALVDEPSGKRLFVTWFDSRESIEAAAAQFESMGDEIPEDIRGRRTSVDIYEVVWDSSADA